MSIKMFRRSAEAQRTDDEENSETESLVEEAEMHDAQADLTAGRSKYGEKGPPYDATMWTGPVICLHLAAGARARACEHVPVCACCAERNSMLVRTLALSCVRVQT